MVISPAAADILSAVQAVNTADRNAEHTRNFGSDQGRGSVKNGPPDKSHISADIVADGSSSAFDAAFCENAQLFIVQEYDGFVSGSYAERSGLYTRAGSFHFTRGHRKTVASIGQTV